MQLISLIFNKNDEVSCSTSDIKISKERQDYKANFQFLQFKCNY